MVCPPDSVIVTFCTGVPFASDTLPEMVKVEGPLFVTGTMGDNPRDALLS